LHKSITSHSDPQTYYFQVKMKLYIQNHSLLLKKTNSALRHHIQTLKSNTLQHLTHWCNKFKTAFPKLVSSVACGSQTKDTTNGYTMAHFYSFMYYTVQHTYKKTKQKKTYSASASHLWSGSSQRILSASQAILALARQQG